MVDKVYRSEQTLKTRFESKYVPDPNTGCWLWTANTSKSGYGKIYLKRQALRAHRVSYEMHYGPIPEGMFVCHTCHTPACVNPNHLYVGTPQDNMNDMIKSNRSMHSEAHHKSKLTREQVLKIRKDKRSQQAIADEYGVTQIAISLIKRGINWRYA